jgi:type II secretory pathway pseudopilin PulG
MAHLNDTWCPGGGPNIVSPFKAAAANASPPGCGVMISADNLPPCRHSPGLLSSDVPSSPSSSFEPAVATLQQQPREPTLQQVLAQHRHNTRWTAAASGIPLHQADSQAATVPQEWQQGASPPQQGRRKIGRPIAFTGDPDSMDLTDADRRRLKRRAANRESARRVRLRRQEMLCATQVRLEKMQDHVTSLVAQLQQAEAERAGFMQQVADLAREHAARRNGEGPASPLEAAVKKEASADCCLPDAFKPGNAAGAQPGADTDAYALVGSEAVVTSGALHSGDGGTKVASAPGDASAPKACRTVTTVGGNAGAAGSGSGSGSGFLPPPLPAATTGAVGRPTVVSVTPSTGTMRLTCAVAPPAITATPPTGQLCRDWGGSPASQGPAYQASLLPELLPPTAQEDWLAGKTSLDLDALPLPPIGSL